MSIWVTFSYANVNDAIEYDLEEDGKSVSDQSIVFFTHALEDMQRLGVDQPFVQEYLHYLASRKACFYGWSDGSQPFDPQQLYDWSMTWIKVLSTAPSTERIDMLQGIDDDYQYDQFMDGLKEFAEFAEKAIADGVQLRMTVG